MGWNEVFQTIIGVFGSTGVAGGIIWKISSYLGEIWAKKYLESIKKEYQKEIEAYKAQIDLLMETALRYSGRQFELYTKLWHSLYDLKSAADMLWEKASLQNLQKFSRQLKKTTDEVEKSYLFIEENHYRKLKNLLKQFCDYQFGKTKLVQLYEQKPNVDYQEIENWINRNKVRKEEYERLIDIIRRDLKKTLKGNL
jgi:Glu-tRNA(Gln) amidotransferase subunit E-like FAD-binding protein